MRVITSSSFILSLIVFLPIGFLRAAEGVSLDEKADSKAPVGVELPKVLEKEGVSEPTETPDVKTSESKPAEPSDESKNKASTELKGIDTLEVDEPGGNWLQKRWWREKAEEKMEKIENAVDRIMDSRMAFFDRRDKADTDLFDPFYIEVGLDQGQLEEIANYLTEQLEEKRSDKKVLKKEELTFLKTIKEEKDSVERAKKDVEAIRKLDVAIDDSITQLIKQINISRKYKKEARQLFINIGKVLDHEKARQLFYKMDASWQSIKGIASYISNDFSKHFDGIESKAKEQIERVKTAMEELEKKGLGFKQQFKKLENKEAKEKEEEEKRFKKNELKKRIEEEQKELKEKPGLMDSIFDSVSSAFNRVSSWFRSGWNWMVSLWPKKTTAPAKPVSTVSAATEKVPVAPIKSEKTEEVEKTAPSIEAPEEVQAVPVEAEKEKELPVVPEPKLEVSPESAPVKIPEVQIIKKPEIPEVPIKEELIKVPVTQQKQDIQKLPLDKKEITLDAPAEKVAK